MSDEVNVTPEEVKNEPEKKSIENQIRKGMQKAAKARDDGIEAAKEAVKKMEEEQPVRVVKLHKKRSEKVAVCGFSPSSRDLAPFADDTWEIWGCNELYQHVPRLNVLFEIHSRKHWGPHFGSAYGKTHVEWQEKCGIPVYHAEKYDDIPTSIPYPWDAIKESFPHGDYLTNAISAMLALAIFMEYKEIGLWGVDMAHHTEFSIQKPSVEYFVGIADGLYRALGWPKMFVPTECNLLSVPYVYGRDMEAGWRKVFKEKSQFYEVQRIQSANAEIQGRDMKNVHQGRVLMIEELEKLHLQ